MNHDAQHEAVQRAIKIAGSQQKLGLAVGAAQANVWKWLHRVSPVPPEIVVEIVEFTAGQVQAHELRPDLPKLFPVPPVPECQETNTPV